MPTSSVLFSDYGLSAFTFRPATAIAPAWLEQLRTQSGHIHLEIEMIWVEEGEVLLEHVGRQRDLTAGEVAVFWAGLPHQVVDLENRATYHIAQIPLVNVLSWTGLANAMSALLEGEVMISSSSESDPVLFRQWPQDLRSGDQSRIIAVELEMQARLRRFLRDGESRPMPQVSRANWASGALVVQTIHYVTRRFMEHLTVDEIAEHVGRHRDHVMQTFRRTCGITVWDYVTRLRVSEAQRMLTWTDLPILAICYRAGFSSVSRMYEAFHRVCGVTPAAYRREVS